MNPYDLLADNYRALSEEKSEYIASIDNLIRESVSGDLGNLLDVGCGDGIRLKNLISGLRYHQILLVDNSKRMIDKAESIFKGKTLQCDANSIPFEVDFSTVFLLWNVLGHIQANSDVNKFMSKLYNNLNSGSRVFVDVNNRYNAISYGFLKVFLRICKDFIYFNSRRGDVNIDIISEGKVAILKGHLFTPQEIKKIAINNGFKIKSMKFVNYKTGKVSKHFFQGQIFLELVRS